MMRNTSKVMAMALTLFTLQSCYMYDGPTRIFTRQSPPPPPPPIERPAPPVVSKSEYMNKAFQEIQHKLPDAEVTIVEDSIKVLFPNNIVYQNSDTYPSTDYVEPLQRFAGLLRKFKKTNILVTGHTDSKGSEEKNKALSKQRAENIKSVIVQQGIAASRLTAWGLGASAPIADNTSEEGRTKNRRVEFVVLYDEN